MFSGCIVKKIKINYIYFLFLEEFDCDFEFGLFVKRK